MFNQLRRRFGVAPSDPPSVQARPAPPPDPEPDDAAETPVPEMSVEELRALQSVAAPFLVVDIREVYEWQQVRLPEDSGFTLLHIPMNTIPEHLDELPRDQPFAVLCAHGSRSYGVTHYLVDQGFRASSVAGGITRWAIAGGAVTRG